MHIECPSCSTDNKIELKIHPSCSSWAKQQAVFWSLATLQIKRIYNVARFLVVDAGDNNLWIQLSYFAALQLYWLKSICFGNACRLTDNYHHIWWSYWAIFIMKKT